MSNSNNSSTHAYVLYLCICGCNYLYLLLAKAVLFVFLLFGKLISASLSLGRLLNPKLNWRKKKIAEKGKLVSIYATLEAFEKC